LSDGIRLTTDLLLRNSKVVSSGQGCPTPAPNGGATIAIMKTFLGSIAAFACLTLVSSAIAETVPAESKLYIDRMNGFENYISAAILGKKIPIIVVTDRAQADYLVTGSWRESNGGTSGNGSLVAPLKRRTNYSASISIVDPKTSALVFAYSSEKSASHDLSKEIADDWANHLKHEMQPKKK
jgi:hypothetical protein